MDTQWSMIIVIVQAVTGSVAVQKEYQVEALWTLASDGPDLSIGVRL